MAGEGRVVEVLDGHHSPFLLIAIKRSEGERDGWKEGLRCNEDQSL